MNKPLYSTPPDYDSPAPGGPDPKAPRFGCFVFGSIFAMFVGILIFVLIHGGRMYEEIVAFTDESPIEIPAERGTPEELTAIREKVAAFVKAMQPVEPGMAELSLNARELNILIANDNYLADIRGRFYVDAIESSGLIRTRCSQPLPKVVFWKPQRYLNGEIDFQVEAAEGRFFLREAATRVPGRTIAQGILDYRHTLDFLDPYKNDERFEIVVKKINSARVENGSLIVSTASADTGTKPAPEPVEAAPGS